MADLYDRLDEIQGMTQVLAGDVQRLRRLVGEQVAISEDEEACRRFYVRAVFALVEAVVEQHKRLLLDLAERAAIALSPGVREALSEQVPLVRENGTVVYREQYLQLERKLRHVIDHPVKEVIQKDGRIRRWAPIDEAEGKYLRVILLPDGETAHNAFFDRSFTP